MKHTFFRLTQNSLFLRSVITFRILAIALLALLFHPSITAANSGSADQAISEDGKTCTWTGLNFTVDKNTTYGANGLFFNAGKNGNISSSNGAVNIKEGRIMYILVPSKEAAGILKIVGSNEATDRTVVLKSGKTIQMSANGSSAEFSSSDIVQITDAPIGYYIQVTSQSDFKFKSVSVTLTNGIYKGEASCTFNIDYSVPGQSDWARECFTQVGTSTEWRLENFVLPDENQQFWVGKDGQQTSGISQTVAFSSITTTGMQGTSNTKFYPGEGAIGTLRIYSDSQDKNYYIGFLPTYMITWGIEGSASPWETAEFAHKDNTTYETTELVTLPDDFATQTYKYYVGPKMENGNVFWIADKSSTDEMKSVNGIKQDGTDLSYASLNGAKGKFRIYDNSGDRNWYCHFVPYYNYILYNEDGTPFHSSEYISSEAQDKATTFPTNVPTKEGYDFVGWARTKDAGTSEMLAGGNYTYWCSNDVFYPVWKEKTRYTLTLQNAEGKVFWETTSYEKQVTLPADYPTKEGAVCLGWLTDPMRAIAIYKAGETYTFSDDNITVTLYPQYQDLVIPTGEQCGTISKTGVYKEELQNVHMTIYQINSGGVPVDEGTTSAFKEANKTADVKASVLSAQRCLIQCPFPISRLNIRAYNSNIGRKIEQVLISSNATKDSYTSLTAEEVKTISPENTKDYNFEISFTEQIPADTYIRVEFSNTVNIWEVCYSCDMPCTIPIVAISGDDLVDGVSAVCENGNWNGWNATATFGTLQEGESCTLQWYKGNTAIEGAVATGMKSPVECTYKPTAEGEYRAEATISAEGKTPSSAEATAKLQLLSAPTTPTINASAASVEQGGSVVLTAEIANGESAVWEQSSDGGTTWEVIEGEVSDTYTWITSTETAAGTYQFRCAAENNCGESAYSDVITVEVTKKEEEPTEECIAGNETFLSIVLDLGGHSYDSKNQYYKFGGTDNPLTITAKDGYYIKEVRVTGKGNGGDGNAFAYRWGTEDDIIREPEKQDLTATTNTYDLQPNGFTPKTFSIDRQLTGSDNKKVGAKGGTIYIEDICVIVASDRQDCGLSYNEGKIERFKTQIESNPIPQALTYPDGLDQSMLSYTSSNPLCATVNDKTGEVTYIAVGTTTITAIFDGDDTYAPCNASYDLSLGIPTGEEIKHNITPTEATLVCGNNIDITVDAELTPETDLVLAYHWYRDGQKVAETTPTEHGDAANKHTAASIGTYKALIITDSYNVWTNEAVVKGGENSWTPQVTRLTRFHYYRKGCDYKGDTDNPLRHLFLVKAEADKEATWVASIGKKNADGTVEEILRQESNNTNAQWIYNVHSAAGDTVMLDLEALVGINELNNAVNAGDVLIVTVTPEDACNNYNDEYAQSIEITVTEAAQRAVAYIVSGGNGSKVTYEEDFIEGVNQSNLHLLTGKNKWDEKEECVLWSALNGDGTYIPTAVNCYAPFDILNYEPFDIIILTDYAKTDGEGAKYVDAIAQLVDVKPFLSLKSYMAKEGLNAWRAKGFVARPYDPQEATRTQMDILCYANLAFSRLDNYEKIENITVLSGGGFEELSNGVAKGLQGFLAEELVGFVNIATIYNDANTLLVTCCERQNVIAARLMVLAINAGAIDKLTQDGIKAILGILDYLLDTDPAHVQDCSIIFEGTEDSNWSKKENWNAKRLPNAATNVHIHADCVVNDTEAAAGFIKIEEGRTLTIAANGALSASQRIGLCDPNNNLNMHPLKGNQITIKSDADGYSGTLIHAATEGWEIPATVEYCPQASGAPNDCQYQWMTIPVQYVANAEAPFAGAWAYGWDAETHTWGNYLRNGDPMTAFTGYCFTQTSDDRTKKKVYAINGTLVNATDREIALTYDNSLSANRKGINVVGNSWTAPINIAGWDVADFENAQAQIILFNTGFDPYGKGAMGTSGTNNTNAGQYSVIPVNAASSLDKALQVIPAMQAFQVNATGEGAKLVMNYNNLVRTESVNKQPMRVQARQDMAGQGQEGGIDTKLRIRIDGERYSDQVYIFRNADCTNGYDNGWDGHKLLGAAAALQLFVESEGERYAVSTQPEIAGTRMAFYKGEDAEYTMSFEYDGEETLYLYDSNTDVYTPIATGNQYVFYSTTTKLEHRFLITDSRPEGPSGPTTGTTEIETDGNSIVLTNTTHESVEVSMYDAAGRLCYQETVKTPLVTLPTPGAKGVYMVEAKTATRQITRKIIL